MGRHRQEARAGSPWHAQRQPGCYRARCGPEEGAACYEKALWLVRLQRARFCHAECALLSTIRARQLLVAEGERKKTDLGFRAACRACAGAQHLLC